MAHLAFRPLVFRAIVALILVNAAAGIIVVAGSDTQIGTTENNVLLTTGLLSLATLLFLPCALAYEAGRPNPFVLLPAAGVSCLLIGFSLAIYLVWADPDGDTLDDIAWSFGIAGAGLAHVCLLSLVSMRRRMVWLQLSAVAFTAALTAMIVSAFWTDYGEAGIDDWKVRLFIVIAILAAATSLLVPVVDRLSRWPADFAGTSRHASFCPNCGAALNTAVLKCVACGARFRVEFLEG